MRLIFVAGTLACLTAAATFACSSATPATATPDAGAKPATTGDDDTTPAPTTTATTPPPVVDPDASTDAGTTETSDGAVEQNSDAGPACDPDSFGEVEPNNDATTANQLPVTDVGTFKFCGQASSTDTDFVTFTMPQNTRRYSVQELAGNVQISGTIGGQPFQIGGGGTQFPNNVQAGDAWVVQIQTGSTTPRAYNIAFQFQSQ